MATARAGQGGAGGVAPIRGQGGLETGPVEALLEALQAVDGGGALAEQAYRHAAEELRRAEALRRAAKGQRIDALLGALDAAEVAP